MITYDTIRDSIDDGKQKMIFSGLSTDEKPLEEYDGIKIANSSTWRNIDDGKYYGYDEAGKAWHEWPAAGGGGGDVNVKVIDGNVTFG